MPNHVVNEIIFRGISPEQRAELLAVCCDENGKVDFARLLPIPLNTWMGSVGEKHEKAFPDNALDWARKNWGTKWNAYGHRPVEQADDTLILRFDTAWRPPYGWLIAVFNRFKVSFDHNWLSEGEERGHSDTFDYAAMDTVSREAWRQAPADDDMHKHLHVLRWYRRTASRG